MSIPKIKNRKFFCLSIVFERENSLKKFFPTGKSRLKHSFRQAGCPSGLRLPVQSTDIALAFVLPGTGSSIPARIMITAITINNSTNVIFFRLLIFSLELVDSDIFRRCNGKYKGNCLPFQTMLNCSGTSSY